MKKIKAIKRRISDLFKSILAASLLGGAVGLIEAVSGILSGPGIIWTKQPVVLEAPLAAKFLYLIFVMSLFIVGFHSVTIVMSLAPVRRDGKTIEFAVPWALFAGVGAIALFAGASGDFFYQIDIGAIAVTSALYLLFIGLCFWEIRRFLRKLPQHDLEGDPRLLAGHWSRSGAFLILFSVAFSLPLNSAPFSPIAARAIAFALILLIAPPLARALSMVFQLIFGNKRTEEASYLHVVAAIALIALPLLALTVLWNRSVEERQLPTAPVKRIVTENPDGPNVVILLVDMLRADHVGWYGYERDTTPNMDAYAKGGVAFRNAFSESSWTLPATVSLLSGLHPAAHGARLAFCSLADEVETMAEIFRQSGYATGAFVTNPNLKQSFNIGQGFDYYYDDFIGYNFFRSATRNGPLLRNLGSGLEVFKLLFSRKHYNVLKTDDIGGAAFVYGSERMDLKNVNARALKWIKKNRERPFLLYLHYLDVHGPYVHPRAFSETVSRDIRETEINYYDGAIRYTDEQIGLFIERLRRLDALENSIVVITSDHGHEFYEHGRLGHGLSLYEEQLHIPLIFLNTRAFPFQGAFSQTVGLIDVLPTLVDHLDLKRQNNAVDGQSLMPLIARGETPEIPDYRYSETERYNLHRSVRYQNRWKYIISESIEPQQLFDLEHDPLERKNLVEEHPELANELKQKLDRKFAELQSRAAATTVVTADEKTVGLLKSLGYLN